MTGRCPRCLLADGRLPRWLGRLAWVCPQHSVRLVTFHGQRACDLSDFGHAGATSSQMQQQTLKTWQAQNIVIF